VRIPVQRSLNNKEIKGYSTLVGVMHATKDVTPVRRSHGVLKRNQNAKLRSEETEHRRDNAVTMP